MAILPTTEKLKKQFNKWFEINKIALQHKICGNLGYHRHKIAFQRREILIIALAIDSLMISLSLPTSNVITASLLLVIENYLEPFCSDYEEIDIDFDFSIKFPNVKLENFYIIKTIATIIAFVVFFVIFVGIFTFSYGSTVTIVGMSFLALLIGFIVLIKSSFKHIIQGISNFTSLFFQGYHKMVKFFNRNSISIPSIDEVSQAHANLNSGEGTTSQDAAIKHYQAALEIFTPELFPHECRQAAYNLGVIFYDKGDCIQARQAFEKAHQALENLWREMSKQRLATENADLYARLVYCCLDKKDNAAAFKYANAAKGRAFIDALNTVNFDIRAATTQNPELNKDWNEYSQVVRWLLAKTQRLIASEKLLNWQTAFEKLLNRQTALWKELTAKYPTLTATQNAPVLSIEQAYALAEDMDATLVEYYQHDKGWSAFVVTNKIVEHVSLPLVNDNLFEEIKKWIGLIENRKPIGYNQIRTRRILSEWHKAIIAPLQMYLPKSGKIIFAPFEKLHLLPVHIAFDPSTEHYLAQDYSIAFIPSLSALRVSLDQTHNKQHQFVQFQRFLNVTYPGVQDSREYDYLQEAIPAAQAIANTLTEIEVTPLYEDKATANAFITHASEQDIIHFFGHGDFVPEHPEKSGLMLAKGWLTVQDVIAKLNLEQVRLTTLGACKTVWLTQALMTAKTQAVVTTLWNVDQDATVALFKTFYNELAKGHDPVEALNLATKTIRERPEWQHPYYWAAFQISGLAYHLK